ncbi:MAG: EAL domain-containing protein [Candidatus Zixiibacteriota bacterium]|jgi:EAL domain-containing protein (putative c-di-GMP-specific phosphodiesterase class I)
MAEIEKPATGGKHPSGRTLWLRLQTLLTDKISSLPTLAARMGDVRASLEECGAVGLIYVMVPRADDLEALYGWQYYDEFIADIGSVLNKFQKTFLKSEDAVVARDIQASEFLIVVRPSSDDRPEEVAPDRLETLRTQLLNYIESERNQDILRGHQQLHFLTANARIIHNLFSRPERLILAAVEDARRSAIAAAESETLRQKELLKRIIVREEVEVLYQPIVSLKDYSIFGFEALSAAAGGSGIEGAEMLFALADEVNLSVQLDRVCRRRAFNHAHRWIGGAQLFLNTNPRTIEEIGTREDALFHLFQDGGVSPESLVLEITERSAIGNLAVFEATLNRFRDHGIGVAVDDAGAGYASLNTIARLKPDYLKFDMALVRDIDKDRVKQELLSTVQELGHRVNAQVIAEGIETTAELETLTRAGVDYGQGYLLSRPKPAADIERLFPHEPSGLIEYRPQADTLEG